jgi:hypothetical protein
MITTPQTPALQVACWHALGGTGQLLRSSLVQQPAMFSIPQTPPLQVACWH